MEQNNGPWKIKARESKYKDAFLELCVDEVTKPNGEPGTYATVQLKRGIAVLPIDDDGYVYLTRQFRYAIGQESTEVISGGMEANEDPLVAAQREVNEELGIEGTRWTELGFLYLETSMLKSPTYLFVVQ